MEKPGQIVGLLSGSVPSTRTEGHKSRLVLFYFDINIMLIIAPTTGVSCIMDELARARAGLFLLEDKSRQLFKELLGVRAAVVTQRAKIDELIRTRPTAIINHLPTEILLSILDLHTNNLHYCYPPKPRKQQLAGVCRRWRDVILGTPLFWTTIHVAESDASSVMTHLERSCGALLDIVIQATPWAQSEQLAIVPSLDIVTSCAHRWRSLLIGTEGRDHDDDDESDVSLAEFIVEKIGHLQFPTLKSVEILAPCSADMDFISAAQAPSLEHLQLQEFEADDINFPAALKSLKLDFYGILGDPSYPYRIPTQALTELWLSKFTEPFLLQPNSIHFPLLKILKITCVERTREFLNAIVTPNLEEFEYSPFPEHPLSFALDGLGDKFNKVRYLHFSPTGGLRFNEDYYADLTPIFEVFPGIRHAEFAEANWLSSLFDPPLNQANSRARRPINLWTELESLTFHGLHPVWLKSDQLSAWLVDRRALGLRRLHVKLIGSTHYGYHDLLNIGVNFPRLYEVLKETCTLELDRFSLNLLGIQLYMPVDSSLRMVGTI